MTWRIQKIERDWKIRPITSKYNTSEHKLVGFFFSVSVHTIILYKKHMVLMQ